MIVDFTACMWNTYRQCQLHLTDLLNRISRSLAKDPEAYRNSKEYAKLCNEVQSFIDGVCASIPFMLVGEKLRGSKPTGSTWFQARPPMLIGGLNLEWVLFTASILDIASQEVKQDMKRILFWIGKNLGIRQATVLAQVSAHLDGWSKTDKTDGAQSTWWHHCKRRRIAMGGLPHLKLSIRLSTDCRS